MRFSIRLLPTFLLLFSACAAARASSITFDKQSGTNFLYNLNVDDNLSFYFGGPAITFTGLSGVFGATNLGYPYLTPSYTATSVTYSLTSTPGFGVFSFGNGTYTDYFTIQSTALLGSGVSYTSLNIQYGSLAGTTSGPTTSPAITPEPSSIALLGTGLLGVAGIVRKRLAM